MKKYLMMLLAAGLICTACGKKEEAQPVADTKVEADEFAEAQKKLDGVEFTDEGLAKLFAAENAMDALEYEALILSYGKCEMKDGKPDAKCIAHKSVGKHKKAHKLDGKEVYKVHKKMLRHKHPAVRGYAYDAFENLEDEATIKEIVGHMQNDKDIYALCKGLESMKNSLKHSKDLSDFVKASAKHEDKRVRMSSARAMGSKWNKEVEGMVEGLRTLMTDGEVDVRKTACEMAGNLGNDALVPDMVKILDNADDAAAHASCAKALVTMWYDYPAHANNSEAAYKATIDYLKKTPRTDKSPDWQAITTLKNTGSKFDAWKEKSAHFKAEELVAAMADIAKDDAVSKLARTNAIEIIAKHGTKADLEGMKEAIDASTSKDAKAVQEKLDKAIADAK